MKILHRNKLIPIKRLKQEIIACIPRSLFCTPTVLKRSIHIFRFALIVGILMSVSANSKAVTVDMDLPFSVVGESMWKPGEALYFHETDFIGLEWDKSIIIPPTPINIPFSDPSMYFQLYGSTSGQVGLKYDFTLSSGSVDISYPVTSTITFPGSAYPGETVSLSSSFVNLNGLESKMETFSPQATAKLELPFKLAANLQGILTFPDYPGSWTSIDLIDPPIDIDETSTLFDLSTGYEYDFPGGFGSIEAQIPVINTDATLSNGKFLAEGSDDFITLTLDVDKVATTLFGLPPLGGTFAWPEPPKEPKVELSYELVDVDALLSAGFKQSFEFTPTLKVEYTLENGYKFVTDVGGAPFDFSIPSNVGDSLDVTAKFFLENQFINNTDLLLTPAINLSALSGEVSLFGLLDFDFGPVYTTEIPLYSFPIDIFDKQFAIEGFKSYENNFSIDIVEGPPDVIPAPGAFVLGSIGVGLVGWLRRIRRTL